VLRAVEAAAMAGGAPVVSDALARALGVEHATLSATITSLVGREVRVRVYTWTGVCAHVRTCLFARVSSAQAWASTRGHSRTRPVRLSFSLSLSLSLSHSIDVDDQGAGAAGVGTDRGRRGACTRRQP
jgi:hypothetical protein